MKLLFTICGRAGSKGIKNKNIRPFLGYPMIYYSLSAIDLYLKKYNEHEVDVVANSDSKELLELAKNNPFFPVDVIERDPKLADDVSPKQVAIIDSYHKMQQRKGVKYDMVVDVEISAPLRTAEDIRDLIAKQIETDADVTFSAVPSRRNPYFNMVMKTEHGYKKVIESNYTARQQAPEIFDMNASLYAWSARFFTLDKYFLDCYCECITMADTGVLDMDHKHDMELMEIIAKYYFDRVEGYNKVYQNLQEKVN